VIPEGAKLDVNELHTAFGGGALNAACSFQQQGFTTTPWCSLGDDPAGATVLQFLKQKNIVTTGVSINPEQITGISCIIASPPGDSALLVYRGASGFLEFQPELYELLANADALYIAPLTGTATVLLPDFLARVRPKLSYIALNPSMAHITSGIRSLIEAIPFCDFFMVNTREARQLMTGLIAQGMIPHQAIDTYHISAEDLQKAPLLANLVTVENRTYSLIHCMSILIQLGAKYIAVTDGARGVYVGTAEKIIYHPALPTIVHNSVGAGDAFGSGFFGHLITKHSLTESLLAGLLNSQGVLRGTDATAGLLSKAAFTDAIFSISTHNLQEYAINLRHQ